MITPKQFYTDLNQLQKSCDTLKNTIFLTAEGLIITEKTLNKLVNIKPFFEKLTIKYKPRDAMIVRTPLYEKKIINAVTCYRLPKGLLSLFTHRTDVKTSVILNPLKLLNDIKTLQPLNQNQKIVVDYLIENIYTAERQRKGLASCILNFKAGMGKTYIAAGIIQQLRVKTLYVVMREKLQSQAVADLQKALSGITVCAYSTARATQCLTADVVVIIINSAIELDKVFYSRFNLLILDEIQSYCSPVNKNIFKKCAANYTLGMSASTEDRKDLLDTVHHAELVMDTDIVRAEHIPGVNYDSVQFNGFARVIQYTGPMDYTTDAICASTGKISVHKMYNQYSSDGYRTRLFIMCLNSLYKWQLDDMQHNIFVFAEEIKILERAHTEWSTQYTTAAAASVLLPIETERRLLIGGTREQIAEQIITNHRIIFTTYAYSSVGLSIPKMSCIIFLTPRRHNMKQICARVLRTGSNAHIPRIVVDIVDQATCLRGQYYERKKAYELYNFNIQKKKVLWYAIPSAADIDAFIV